MTVLSFFKKAVTNRSITDFIACVEHEEYEAAMEVIVDIVCRGYGITIDNKNITYDDLTVFVSDELGIEAPVEGFFREFADYCKVMLLKMPSLEEVFED